MGTIKTMTEWEDALKQEIANIGKKPMTKQAIQFILDKVEEEYGVYAKDRLIFKYELEEIIK